jgi:hypothetical protein
MWGSHHRAGSVYKFDTIMATFRAPHARRNVLLKGTCLRTELVAETIEIKLLVVVADHVVATRRNYDIAINQKLDSPSTHHRTSCMAFDSIVLHGAAVAKEGDEESGGYVEFWHMWQ